MTATKFLTILLISSLAFSFCIAQEEGFKPSEKYFARTIAYYDNAVIIGEVLRPPSEKNRRYFASLIEKQIKLPRFYWESLPDEIVSKFNDIVKEKNYKSVDELNQDVEIYLAPEIVKILDINKEIRALSLVTEAERNSFIATKAKSLGISAEKVERVMNSGYVVVPFIEKYHAMRDTIIVTEKSKNDEKRIKVPVVRVTLQGGLTFFRVIFKENQYFVKPEFAVVPKEEGKSFFEIKGGDISAAEDSAFMKSAFDVVMNFELTIRNIFRLYTPIAEVDLNSVSFPLGKREGIGIDDGFDVVEMVEQPDGTIKPKNVGFVRVIKVADNTARNEFTRAQIIIGGLLWGKIERGMMVVERPRFPVDFIFGGFMAPVKIQTGKFKLNESRVANDTLEIKSHGRFAYLGWLNINLNTGRISGSQVSQLWFIFGGGVGVMPIEARFFGEEVEGAIFGSFNMGLLKKFYFRRLAFLVESGVGLSNFKFSIEKKGADTVKYALSPRRWFWNGSVGAGLELVLNPDVNLGGRVRYQITSETNEWTYLRKVRGKDERKKMKLGNVNLSGFSFQLYLNISIKNFAKVKRFD